jgi:hypothetical protein
MKLSYTLSILLLCIVLFSTALPQSREIHKILPLKPDGRLVIDTYKGSITITTHEKEQVEVDVKIESDERDSHDADQDVEDTEIQISGGEREVTIHTNYKEVERHHNHHSSFWAWISDPFEPSYVLPLVHYTIKMPRTAELRIKDYKSRTRIENLHADLRLNTYKGEAEIENLIGGIDLETYKGTMDVAFSKIKNDSRIETYKGNITIVVPKDNGFVLQTDFERRVDFSTDFDVDEISRDRKHHHYDYSGKIHGGGPTLELKSEKGDFRLKEK